MNSMNRIHFFIRIRKSDPNDLLCNRLYHLDSPDWQIEQLNKSWTEFLYISIPSSCVKKAYSESIFKLMCAGDNSQKWPLPLRYVMDADGSIVLLSITPG